MTTVIHLICGSTGAGKTTYALALAARESALQLSIDEWMMTLFGPDQPPRADFQWMMARVERCEAQMWAVALQASELGTAVVVDCGLTREAQRAKWAKLAEQAGLPVRLHYLDVDIDERWRRVQARNVERGPTYRLEVTRAMFNFIESVWEPPSDAELERLNGSRIKPSA